MGQRPRHFQRSSCADTSLRRGARTRLTSTATPLPRPCWASRNPLSMRADYTFSLGLTSLRLQLGTPVWVVRTPWGCLQVPKIMAFIPKQRILLRALYFESQGCSQLCLLGSRSPAAKWSALSPGICSSTPGTCSTEWRYSMAAATA